jgi:HEAT repeat protein
VLRAARGSDPAVQAACARGLAEVPGAEALAALVRLAGARAAEVRQAAVASLARRPEPEAREAAAHRSGDEDPRVRAASAPALDGAQLRQTLLADPSPEVRSAGLAALLAREGARAGLPDALRLLAPAGGGRARVVLAMGFLGATREDRPQSKR